MTVSDPDEAGRGADAVRDRIARLPSADRSQALRVLEARLFASPEPLKTAELATSLPDGADVAALLEELRGLYAGRGVNLVSTGDGWMFRTADDLAPLMTQYAVVQKRLSKAALETLAIIAYHQPVTRAEIEDVRGVATSKGTLDALMEQGWVRPRGRRRAPGRPVTYGTTPEFLAHFSLESIRDLPGMAELKAAGFLDGAIPADFVVPEPTDVADLLPDELPLEDEADGAVQDDLFDEPADADDMLGTDEGAEAERGDGDVDPAPQPDPDARG